MGDYFSSYYFSSLFFGSLYFGVSISGTVLGLPQSISDVLISSSTSSLISYLPQWFNAWSDPTSTLRKFFIPPQEQLLALKYYSYNVQREFNLNNWLGELSHGWYTSTGLKDYQITSVNIYGYNVNKAFSDFEFIDAIPPIFRVDNDTGNIYLRNLDISIISVTSTGTIYLGPNEIRHSSNLYWSFDGVVWNLLDSDTSQIDYLNGVVNLSVSGNIYLVYSSVSQAASADFAKISINNGPLITLSKMDYWNSFDELGLRVDLERIPYEDNYSYFNRLRTSYPFMGASTPDGLRRGIARNLNMLSISYWDGFTTLTFQASSNFNHLWVHGLPLTSYINEKLNLVNNIYYGSFEDWQDPYIFNNSIVVNLEASGGKIYTTNSYSNGLYASYICQNYTVTTSGNSIISLQRNENTIKNIYEVGYCGSIEVNTVNNLEYRQANLLDGDSVPNNYFLSLSNIINQKVPTTLGFTFWGKTHWFTNTELSPGLDFLNFGSDFEN